MKNFFLKIFFLITHIKGGAKGPGIFFVIPCVDNYRKVDLRTVSFDVPPQGICQINTEIVFIIALKYFSERDFVSGFRHSHGGCCGEEY